MVSRLHRRRLAITVIGIALVANLVWLVWISRTRNSPPSPRSPAPVDITGDVPIQRQRIDDFVAAIRKESLDQSIENMSLHEQLLVRAAMETYPTAPSPRATERCLANRRVARVFEDFSILPDAERADRSRRLFDKAFQDFSDAANLILTRWENERPPQDTTELFGEQRSIDGYFWAVCGAELICAEFGSAELAISNRQRMFDLRQALESRVAQNPGKLTLPYSEIKYFLLPDLFQLNLAAIVYRRHFDVKRLDTLIPDEMTPLETRFYRWNADTNEQDFTFQRRGVPPDESKILHKFSFYQTWHEAGRLNEDARQRLITTVWNDLKKLSGFRHPASSSG